MLIMHVFVDESDRSIELIAGCCANNEKREEATVLLSLTGVS